MTPAPVEVDRVHDETHVTEISIGPDGRVSQVRPVYGWD